MQKQPNWQQRAQDAFEQLTGEVCLHIKPLLGGSINYVFCCTGPKTVLVMRLAPWSQADNRLGAARWATILSQAGTKVVPYIAQSPISQPAPFFWMAMPFVPGVDLGLALPGMSTAHQLALAQRVFEQQNMAVKALAPYVGGPVGRALSPQARYPEHPSLAWGPYLSYEMEWRVARLERKRMEANPPLVCSRPARVQLLMEQAMERLAVLSEHPGLNTPPVGFLYDIGDRNTIVLPDGRITGIVDQDCVFFGDRLLAPVLAQATLRSLDYPADSVFVKHWLALEYAAQGVSAQNIRVQALRLFCAIWGASQTGGTARNGQACPWDELIVVGLLEEALAA